MRGQASTVKPSNPKVVDEFMNTFSHPLLPVAMAVREAILRADPNIGEEIKWNAPAFFFSGTMQEGNPKEYRRYLVVFNFHRKDCLRLVFWHGDRAADKSGFLQGDYPDGRRLGMISSTEDLALKSTALRNALRAQIKYLAA